MTSKSCPGFTNSENSPITFIVLASIFTAPISTISDGSSDLYGLKFLYIKHNKMCSVFQFIYLFLHSFSHTYFIFSIYLFIHFMHVILRLKNEKFNLIMLLYIGGYSIKMQKKKASPSFSTITSC